ncbi:MAG TPA: hypothetical protein VFV37_09495, partial [Luteibaculaceae bacterium]|nr:hypothetical protein [Luteibaculaceae bacterium]
MRWWLIYISLFLFAVQSYGQSGNCSSNTPFFTVDLTGNPNGTYVSPAVSRAGTCCGNSNPDRCLEFQIRLDPNAVAIEFDIASGAIPPGALFYQIGCGPLTPVGEPICLNGPGPHTLTFCKPGNNENTYSIRSISAPVVSPDRITRVGCTSVIGTQGIQLTSITWREITSGNNQYASYLSCTSGCDTTIVTPTGTPPPFVDYVICGIPTAGNCYPQTYFCDTIRVSFQPNLVSSVNPNPAVYCAGDPGITLIGNGVGGFPPYTYVWRNGSGTQVSTAKNYFATAGNYTFEVRDSLFPSCPGNIQTVAVTAQPRPLVSAGPDRTFCATSSGVVLNGFSSNASGVQWSGGSGTFSPSSTTVNPTYRPSLVEIGAGSVTLAIATTGNGVCPPARDSVRVVIVPAVRATVSGDTMLCPGETTTLSARVTGGTAPYTYSWNTGATSASISNLGPGTYILTVTDASNGSCSFTDTTVVYEAPPVSVNIAADTLRACRSGDLVNASANGSANVISYLWSTGDGGASVQLPIGKHTVRVTDQYGCTATDSVVVALPATPLGVTFTASDPNCFGSTGTLSAQGVGGYSGYSYSWNTGETTKSITKTAGTYCVVVTDQFGCNTAGCANIQELQPFVTAISGKSILCANETTTLSTSTSGGKPSYSYLWNTGATTSSISGVGPGTYTVVVTDNSGFQCQAFDTLVVTRANDIFVNITSDTLFACSNSISATASTRGGYNSITFLWSNGDGTPTTQVGPGKHFVTVTDSLGCKASDTVIVVVPAGGFLSAAIDSIAPLCFGTTGTITASGLNGYGGYTYQWASGESTRAVIKGAGTWSVTVTDVRGCVAQSCRVIQQLDTMTAVIQGPALVCVGSTGTIRANVSGGKSPYSYLWSNGSTTQQITVGRGTYTVLVTDASGRSCQATASFTINEAAPVVASIGPDTLYACSPLSVLTVSATGGAGTQFTYTWSNGDGTPTTQVGPGKHFVTVTDSLGCKASDTVTVVVPAGGFLSAAIDSIAPLCFGTTGT